MRALPIIGRVVAFVLVAAAFASLWALWSGVGRPPLFLRNGAEAGNFRTDRNVVYGTNKGSTDPQLKRVHKGDRIDMAAVPRTDVYDLVMGTMERPVTYPMIDTSGRHYAVTLAPVRAKDHQGEIVDAIVNTLATIVSIFLAVLLLLRRPGALAFAFAIYCTFTINTQALVQAIGVVPEPEVRAGLQSLALLTTFYLGSFALVAFALRFPTPLDGRIGTLAMRFVEAAIAACTIAALALDPRTFSSIADALQQKLFVACIVAVVAIVAVRFTRADAHARQRLGWVLAGALISAVCGLSEVADIPRAPTWGGELVRLASEALPIAVAYAVLRHRVIDVGFAINRTLVFSLLTLLVVTVIVAVDRIVDTFLQQSRVLEGGIEAVVSVALGLVFTQLHERMKYVVERFLFRERHAAEKRLEGRIAALDFAETEPSVDHLLTSETCEILHLRSAAVFRARADNVFERTAAVGWEASPTTLERDHLVVRILRAQERSLLLAEERVRDPRFPQGDAYPQIAIPIVRRHRLLGIAFYGHEAGEETLDPAERALVERAVAAAANAYDAIEAATYRRDANMDAPITALGRRGARDAAREDDGFDPPLPERTALSG
jgi:hypothetical protein